jgi:NADH:ubiquinone oxidoreductase subunit D
MPYTDRVDYVAAMFCNQGWAMAVERLADIAVPKRGEYCRVVAAELNRIASHLLSVGTMVLDIGAITPFFHAFREREKINDLLEELCGARLTYNYMRIGGVAWDLPPGYPEKVGAFLDRFEPMLEEYHDLISVNKIYIERCAGVAVISPEEAVNYNLVGSRTCAPRGVRWRRAPRRAVLGLSRARVRRAGRRCRARGAGRQLRALRDPHPRNEGERQDPAPVLPADAGRSGDRESSAQVQAAGR